MPPSRPPESLSYLRAINEALASALASDPDVVIFGEDVAIPDGPFGATKGLHQRYGDRVFDTPISESAMIGAALGAAIGGLRPVVEVMFADFLLVAMDQIVNQVANTRYVSKGQLTAPLTIRTQQGLTPGSCAQHSQSLEGLFAHIPGLRIAVPSTPDDAYQITRSAIACDDPAMVFEARRLYPLKGDVNFDAPIARIGKATLRRKGTHVTIVTWGTGVAWSQAAASLLAQEGIDAEIIDVRWIAPLDENAILESVSRTGRLLVVHEANVTGGFGAEIISRVFEAMGTDLRAAGRVGLPDCRIPAAPTLSAALLPDEDRIFRAAKGIAER